ncbi:hypothetical protein AXG93_4031s1500 [Marchantia polymorpha subsp. ruderalis]|uniref:Uncharacterized protein n=1 Tax=Marchantia polymorpha subsp. ruderalis TaxID=1480154 RepID=A0A176WDA3_MARPO|nr:hypothetical protein AXG93_4031s1500 [Marchantia polymorpha subsp. ruderalis]
MAFEHQPALEQQQQQTDCRQYSPVPFGVQVSGRCLMIKHQTRPSTAPGSMSPDTSRRIRTLSAAKRQRLWERVGAFWITIVLWVRSARRGEERRGEERCGAVRWGAELAARCGGIRGVEENSGSRRVGGLIFSGGV